jgi:hypothetical protein
MTRPHLFRVCGVWFLAIEGVCPARYVVAARQNGWLVRGSL